MQNLFSLNLIDILNEVAIKDRKPILGICLGMQLMTKFSEEGNIKGLSWFNAKTIKFSFDDNLKLKIPHMGWNEIVYNENSPLLKNLPKPSKFYFVHSYYVHTNNNSDIIGTCSYGNDFTCILNKDNIFGTQFHPEKSHKYGIQIFENFISL